MIKRLIKWLFSKEFDAARAESLSEARALIESAKQTGRKVYVKYDVMDLDGPRFLHGIQPVLKCDAFIAWMQNRKETLDHEIKYGNQALLQNNLGRAIAIDAILRDIEVFTARYDEMLNERAELTAAEVVPDGR